MIHDNVADKGAINHYIEDHGTVPLWILINYLTIGNLSYYKNRRIVVAVLYFKAVLDKSYYK